jgi:hypothetical protein
MSRQPPVSIDEVRSALHACLANCEAPSADRLLARIGHGSKGTILKLRDQTIEEIRSALKGHALPAELPQALIEPVTTFWAIAQSIAFERLKDERDVIEQAVSEARAAQQAALDRAQQVDQERDRLAALADERARSIEILRAERDQARQELKNGQYAHALALEKAQALHQAERDGLRQQVDQGKIVLEELRIEQGREREYWSGQEQQYVRMAEEARTERDQLNEKLRALDQTARLEQERLFKNLQESQKVVRRAEARESVIEEELQQLRERLERSQKSAMEGQVRAEHCEARLAAERAALAEARTENAALQAAAANAAHGEDDPEARVRHT